MRFLLITMLISLIQSAAFGGANPQLFTCSDSVASVEILNHFLKLDSGQSALISVEFAPLDVIRKVAPGSVLTLGGMKNGEWHQMSLKSCAFKKYDEKSDKIYYSCPKSPSNMGDCSIDNVTACELKPSEMECKRE
jgi:phosphoribosylaminoimidazole-succinocarboxamide synthase